ncbi:MAG: hypothetical protein AAB663_01620 [Patescibacteria group bacterium]
MHFTDRVYGDIIIDDPCAVAIIESPAFDRLWRVNQYGPMVLLDAKWSTSRAEHCIGVYRLLQLLGASREECLAGLVHDANHLAFSHLVDWLIGDSATQEGHGAFVANPHLASLKDIFDAHELDGAAIMDTKRFTLLEQDAPAMCADRVDYTLRDGITSDQCSKEECATFIEKLANHHGVMALTDVGAAEWLSRLSVDMHIVREGLGQNGFYAHFGAMLKALLSSGKLTREDFLVDDNHVMAIIRAQTDDVTMQTLAWVAAGAPVEPCTADIADYTTNAKLRVIDPHVVVDGSLCTASSLRPGLARLLKEYTLLRKNTFYIRITKV